MIHVSEMLDLPVVDSAHRRVGRLDDVVVDSGQASVEQLVVRQGRERTSVAWSAVDSLSPDQGRVVLNEGADLLPADSAIAEGEALSLRRDVLDRQIIDIHGRKVVRVNDIVLESEGGRLFLRRVEVGLAGAVRRLFAGIVSPRLVRGLAAGLSQKNIPWDYVGLVDPRSATIRLKVHQQLTRMHPADLADIIEDLGRVERQTIVANLDAETAAQALSETEPEVQAAVVEQINPERAADLLEEMPPDEAADILGDLPQERSEAVLEAMEEDDAEDVRELLAFREDSAGGLMTTEFFRASERWTAGDVLEALQGFDEQLAEDLDEVPVVTEDERLVGTAPLVRLLRSDPAAAVVAACRPDSPAVAASAPFREVVDLFEKYSLRSLAVVDEHRRLVGLISVEDVLRRLARKA